MYSIKKNKNFGLITISLLISFHICHSQQIENNHQVFDNENFQILFNADSTVVRYKGPNGKIS